MTGRRSRDHAQCFFLYRADTDISRKTPHSPAQTNGTFWTVPGRRALRQALSEHSAINDKIVLSAEDEADLDATIQKIAASQGYVSNLMQTLVLAPQGLAAFSALNNYTRYGSRLTELQRQLAIIIAVRDVHYGWTHHEPLARAVGVTNEQLLLIRDGRVPKDLAPADHALCDYAFEITAGRRVPQRIAEAVHANFSPRQIVDIALLTSYSMAVAALALGLEVQIEPPETLQFELEWQQQRTSVPIPTETG